MNNLNITNLHEITKNLDILYIEDDIYINNSITEVLEDLFHNVCSKFDGDAGLNAYKEYYLEQGKYFDLVISDIKMPKLDGVELSKEIYKLNSSQSIIIVSAHNESNYLIDLINIGVERFLQKPFNQTQLLETLHLILKNTQENNSTILLGSNLKWDMDNDILTHNNNEINLTKKEMLLLKLFIKNAPKITTTDEMFNTIWEDDIYNASMNSLKMHISRLRKKLHGLEIETLYNIGYRLNF